MTESLTHGAVGGGVSLRPPLVVDTDIGTDPDDTLALVIAARHIRRLALVVTSDERDGLRARMARLVLDLCGRHDVPVVTGVSAPGSISRVIVADLLPAPQNPLLLDLTTAMDQLSAANGGPIQWVGLGPMTNLAALLQERRDLAKRLRVTRMGGALAYRDPNRAEHNVRLDVPAADLVLATARHLHLVTSDVTFTPELEVTLDSPLAQAWARAGAPRWAQLLRCHLHRWVQHGGHPGSMAHDPLTLAVALGHPLVSFRHDRLALDGIGRTRLATGGHLVHYTHTAHYPAIRRWLHRCLDPWSSGAT